MTNKKAGTKKKTSRKQPIRPVARKKTTRKKATRAKAIRREEPGYSQTSEGVYAPDDLITAGKLRKGIESVAEKMEVIVGDLATINGYEIREVEVPASFDTNGTFLGFGVCGDVSVKLRLRPIGPVE